MRTAARSRLGLILAGIGLLGVAGIAGWWWVRPALPELPGQVLVSIRGHDEVVVRSDGTLLPLVLDGTPGICLEAPVELETSGWQAALALDAEPDPAAVHPPDARMGRALCFDLGMPSSSLAAGTHELCGIVTDPWSGRSWRIGCRELAVRPGRAEPFHELEAAMGELFSRPAEQGSAALVDELERLGARARASRFPLLAVRLELIAVFFEGLEGGVTGLDRARQRLDRLPAWIEQQEADRWGAVAAFERARLELQSGRVQQAWQLLDVAEARARRIAHPRRLMITMLEAELIARGGALGEAIARLRAALDDCEQSTCEVGQVLRARDQLAWFVTEDPDASTGELIQADDVLAAALGSLAETSDLLERANLLINRAQVEVRLGRDAGPSLLAARDLLGRTRVGEARRRYLAAWTSLVAGLDALGTGHPGQAVELCREVAADPEDADLAARAFSCIGRAQRALGRLDLAALLLDRACAVHRYAVEPDQGQRLTLGPGQMAEDVSRAARVAVEQGRADRAWVLLASLDTHLADAAERRRCRDRVEDPRLAARWAEIDDEIRTLLDRLVAVELPLGSVAGRQGSQPRRSLMLRLQALQREWPGCGRTARGATMSEGWGRGLRAFALEDEILLLHRDAAGQVTLLGREPMPRQGLRALLDRVDEAMSSRALDDAAWQELVAPLSRALVPADPDLLGPITSYALHGLLHRVPVAALGLPEARPGPGEPVPARQLRWLSDRTLVVLRPAGVADDPARGLDQPPGPLLVVDPLENLASGQRQLELYQGLYPEARLLYGRAASRPAVIRALGEVESMHFDGHGHYDAAFPELSSLQLADGPLTLVELAALPMPRRLANLSGCQTGRWPVVAGAGHYGIAGLLARRGVAWVVASRATLDDRLAARFNRALHEAAVRGATIPEAYREALAAVRRSDPAVAWAALMLVQGRVGDGQEGKTPLVMTPEKGEGGAASAGRAGRAASASARPGT
jgi:hypothetical protein